MPATKAIEAFLKQNNYYDQSTGGRRWTDKLKILSASIRFKTREGTPKNDGIAERTLGKCCYRLSWTFEFRRVVIDEYSRYHLRRIKRQYRNLTKYSRNLGYRLK